ncbi:hypothetical protein PI23P_05887 [Polaribacter irgensii 23-P]|uniref:Uncharacterized protein n=1 Tax=Polaribacter irgensii 23-P TaxID=313594 RepID=A4BYG4_9FLAO|nr:hypothetical protein PI23P_05887 [Polaribacter irgensii 23-P]
MFFVNKKNKSGGRGFQGGFLTDTIFTAVI